MDGSRADLLDPISMASGSALPPERPDYATPGDIALLTQRIDAVDRRMDGRFDAIDRRMDDRFGAVNDKLNNQGQRLERIERVLEQMVSNMGQISERIARIEGYRAGWVQLATWLVAAASAAVSAAAFVWKTLHG